MSWKVFYDQYRVSVLRCDIVFFPDYRFLLVQCCISIGHHYYDRVTIDLPGKTTGEHLPQRNSSVPIRVQDEMRANI